jgi:hypothetical protein
MLPWHGRLFAFAVAAMAALAAPITAFATPVSYVFEPGAVLINPAFANGQAPVNGSFTVDLQRQPSSEVCHSGSITVMTPCEENVNISFMAAGPNTFGPTTDILPDLVFNQSIDNAIYACQGNAHPDNCMMSAAPVLHILFGEALDGSGPAHLIAFEEDIDVGGESTVLLSGIASGTADPVPTPEPTSLAVMAAALGLFLLGSPVKRAQSDHFP